MHDTHTRKNQRQVWKAGSGKLLFTTCLWWVLCPLLGTCVEWTTLTYNKSKGSGLLMWDMGWSDWRNTFQLGTLRSHTPTIVSHHQLISRTRRRRKGPILKVVHGCKPWGLQLQSLLVYIANNSTWWTLTYCRRTITSIITGFNLLARCPAGRKLNQLEFWCKQLWRGGKGIKICHLITRNSLCHAYWPLHGRASAILGGSVVCMCACVWERVYVRMWYTDDGKGRATLKPLRESPSNICTNKQYAT